MVDSVGDLEEDKSSSVGSLLFEDTEEDGSWPSGDSKDEPDHPRVQEKVGSGNDGISNSTKICDFLKISVIVLADPIVVMDIGLSVWASVLTRIYRPKGTNSIS